MNEGIEILKVYLQDKIDTGFHKLWILSKDYDVKTVDLLNAIDDLQQENKNLVCNNIILNEDRRLMSKQLNDIKTIIKECKMLYPHEFDWEEQADYILNIIERSNSDVK